MNENLVSAAQSSTKTVSAVGGRAKERLLAQVRQEPVKTFSVFLAGSILVTVLIGYRIARMEQESRRQRLLENWIQEVTTWIGRHGRMIATPIKESLDATKSAVEEVSNSSARVGRQVYPFVQKQKRSFFNLF